MGKTSFIDLTGKRFGKLLVLRRDGWHKKHKNILWLCRCDCGSETTKQGRHLREGQSVSCKLPGSHSRLGEGEAAFRMFYRSTRDNAKKRSLEFSVSTEDAKIVSKMSCFYCGCPPSNTIKGSRNRCVGDYTYNGFDRVDNNLGYNINNIVACCAKCNQAKCRLTIQEFRELIINIHNNWASK